MSVRTIVIMTMTRVDSVQRVLVPLCSKAVHSARNTHHATSITAATVLVRDKTATSHAKADISHVRVVTSHARVVISHARADTSLVKTKMAAISLVRVDTSPVRAAISLVRVAIQAILTSLIRSLMGNPATHIRKVLVSTRPTTTRMLSIA